MPKLTKDCDARLEIKIGQELKQEAKQAATADRKGLSAWIREAMTEKLKRRRHARHAPSSPNTPTHSKTE